MRESIALWLRRLACLISPWGHQWTHGPDTDDEGWFFADGWGAWGISRNCDLCFRFEHQTDTDAGRDRVAAALDRRRALKSARCTATHPGGPTCTCDD